MHCNTDSNIKNPYKTEIKWTFFFRWNVVSWHWSETGCSLQLQYCCNNVILYTPGAALSTPHWHYARVNKIYTFVVILFFPINLPLQSMEINVMCLISFISMKIWLDFHFQYKVYCLCCVWSGLLTVAVSVSLLAGLLHRDTNHDYDNYMKIRLGN